MFLAHARHHGPRTALRTAWVRDSEKSGNTGYKIHSRQVAGQPDLTSWEQSSVNLLDFSTLRNRKVCHVCHSSVHGQTIAFFLSIESGTDLGKLLKRQAALFGDGEAVVCPGRARLTYYELNDKASRVCKSGPALRRQPHEDPNFQKQTPASGISAEKLGELLICCRGIYR
jgi:hypothetical protein